MSLDSLVHPLLTEATIGLVCQGPLFEAGRFDASIEVGRVGRVPGPPQKMNKMPSGMG